MTKKNKDLFKTVQIKDAIFFPEDFAKLPKHVIIHIDRGVLLVPKRRMKKDGKLSKNT